MIIEVENLGVAYGSGRSRVAAVDGVSFAVEEGSCFGLIGESGSGKSTVLRAICGLEEHWTGAIRVAGEAQRPRRPLSFYGIVQMVFQDPFGSLHPRRTVNQILSEPARLRGLSDVRERVRTALRDVGLPASMRFRYPHQLSGGQRQRVSVARALMNQPRVILLDEPTSALDVSVQAEVLNLLSRLRRERNLTYILVSHDIAVIDHMSDRVGVMLKGQLVEKLDGGRIRLARHEYTRSLVKESL